MDDPLLSAKDCPHVMTSEVIQEFVAALVRSGDAGGISVGSMLIILRTSAGTEIRHQGCGCSACQTVFRKAVQAITAKPPTPTNH